MNRAVVLANPRARSGRTPPVGRILAAFRSSGWDAELWAGDWPGWTERAARRAVELEVDAIFGAGGDGVLASILPAIIGTDVVLGVVPLGTGNVWARELGLPLDVRDAITSQLETTPRRVDTGLANGMPFLVVASAGFDARIVYEVEASAKALGQMSYPIVGLGIAGQARGVRCRVTIDDDAPFEMSLLAGIATNGRLYGGLVPLVPQARIDDGLLDMVLFGGSGAVDAAAHAARVIAGVHGQDRNVIMRPARRLVVEAVNGSLPIQADGDPHGNTPLVIEVQPASIRAFGLRPSQTA